MKKGLFCETGGCILKFFRKKYCKNYNEILIHLGLFGGEETQNIGRGREGGKKGWEF